MASHIEDEAGSSPVTDAEVNVVGTLGIHKRKVKAKKDGLSRLRTPLLAPDEFSVRVFGSTPIGRMDLLASNTPLRYVDAVQL